MNRSFIVGPESDDSESAPLTLMPEIVWLKSSNCSDGLPSGTSCPGFQMPVRLSPPTFPDV